MTHEEFIRFINNLLFKYDWHPHFGVEEFANALIENAENIIPALVEPTPEPWTLIPEGRENAAVLRVNGVVLGPVWRENRSVLIDSVSAVLEKKHLVAYAHQITSVEPVQVVPEGARVLSEGEVAVPGELVERATFLRGRGMHTADLPEVRGLVRDLAAVEGGGE